MSETLRRLWRPETVALLPIPGCIAGFAGDAIGACGHAGTEAAASIELLIGSGAVIGVMCSITALVPIALVVKYSGAEVQSYRFRHVFWKVVGFSVIVFVITMSTVSQQVDCRINW